MTHQIIHLKQDNRFVTVEDGITAYTEYELADGYLNILHTIVPREIGGRGIAADLVREAYSYARDNGLKPKATCTYAAAWLARNGESLK